MAKCEGETSRCCGKRPRMASPHCEQDEPLVADSEEHEEAEDDEDEDEQVVEPHSNDSSGAEKIRSISVTLTDSKLLDCPVCFESLKIPVFQCDSGHIACSSCCSKLKYKCSFCNWSIGYIRCRAIEKVLESAKTPCQHSQYGCKAKVSYSNKDDHEGKCPYTPYFCPISKRCKFLGLFYRLSKHLLNNHSLRAKRFQVGRLFPVSIGKKYKSLLLEEDSGGSLFILSNTIESAMGNAISITCVGPRSLRRGFSYDLIAKSEGTTLRLQSVTENVSDQGNSPSTGFLIVPTDFFGSSQRLKLDLCIRASCTSTAGT